MGDGAAGSLSNAAMEKTEDPMSLRLCSELTLCSDSSACTACGAPTVAGRALRLVLAASGARGPLLVAGRGREGGCGERSLPRELCRERRSSLSLSMKLRVAFVISSSVGNSFLLKGATCLCRSPVSRRGVEGVEGDLAGAVCSRALAVAGCCACLPGAVTTPSRCKLSTSRLIRATSLSFTPVSHGRRRPVRLEALDQRIGLEEGNASWTSRQSPSALLSSSSVSPSTVTDRANNSRLDPNCRPTFGLGDPSPESAAAIAASKPTASSCGLGLALAEGPYACCGIVWVKPPTPQNGSPVPVSLAKATDFSFSSLCVLQQTPVSPPNDKACQVRCGREVAHLSSCTACRAASIDAH